MDSKPKRTHLYQSVFILNMVFFVCGTVFGWSSPVLVKLQLTDSEGSTVASVVSLGMMMGPFISGIILDLLGRKGTIGLGMGLMSLSWLILTVAKESFTILTIGRFLGGITCGIAFSAIPLYIAEISEDSVRGILNTLCQLSACSGTLMVYSVGPLVSYAVLHYIVVVLCVIFFLLFPLLPNSPYYMIIENNVENARDTLTWLRENRSQYFVEKELQIIQDMVYQDQKEKGSLKKLFTSVGNRHALFLCVGLLILQQISGITIITFYAEKIFLMTGTKLSSSTCSIVIGLIMTLSAFICPIAVKHFGYKKPLLASSGGMALGMGGLGVFFLLKLNDFEVDSISWLPLLSVVVYILFFNSGFATIPWAISGEYFPSNIKPLATMVITATCAFFAFLTAKFFPNLIVYLGLDFLFMSCSFFCCIAIVFISLTMQDTSGLSFAEIQEILNGRKRSTMRLNQPV